MIESSIWSCVARNDFTTKGHRSLLDEARVKTVVNKVTMMYCDVLLIRGPCIRQGRPRCLPLIYCACALCPATNSINITVEVALPVSTMALSDLHCFFRRYLPGDTSSTVHVGCIMIRSCFCPAETGRATLILITNQEALRRVPFP